MHASSLEAEWTVRPVDSDKHLPGGFPTRPLPATVPGCVHTDLMAAGLINDPYLDQNELSVQWIGHVDWQYRCSFDVEPALRESERLDLVCEGLDTVATLSLNGHPLGRAENMHCMHRFDLREHVRPTGNELVVTFESALRYAENKEEALGTRPHVFPHPYNFIRKMACNFGWDWGPTLVTAGIWRPIRLEGWSTARITSVRPLVEEARSQRATVAVHIRIARTGTEQPLEVDLTLKNPTGKIVAEERSPLAPGATQTKARLHVDDPERWWPAGHGAQPLHSLEASLRDAESPGAPPLDDWRARIGLRTVALETVALETEPDAAGSDAGTPFTLVVNGKPVFCKGANWIPDDCFPHRVDTARYRKRLAQAKAANMNMVRVWGGGFYESDDFYEACDELGLMVWQDFAFSCAFYPEEEPFRALVEKEARQNVERLAAHPSLVLWNGNNENHWFYHSQCTDDGTLWREAFEGQTWGGGFYQDLLPRIVRELDPSRPYWPGSPYAGSPDVDPQSDDHGCSHVWAPWRLSGGDYETVRRRTPRFVSEFGHQAPPTYATLKEALPPEALSLRAPAFLHHQKAEDGQALLNEHLATHFHLPDSLEDWLYQTHVLQARAVAAGIEWYRSMHPHCTGALFWQLNDCWPVTSWAAIDGAGRLKPLWYAARRAFADRLLTVQPEKNRLSLFAVNDHDAPWQGEAVVRRCSFDGHVLAKQHEMLDVPPRSVSRFRLEEISQPAVPERELIAAASGEIRTRWFFERDNRLHYPESRFDAALERDGDAGYELTIEARALLRDICIYADRLDADAMTSDQVVTLLPGESHTFRIASDETLSRSALTEQPVFWCANAFGAALA